MAIREGKLKLGVILTVEQRDKLKILAKEEGTSMSKYVGQMIEKEITKKHRRKK